MNLKAGIYFSILVSVTLICMLRWKKLSLAERFIAALMFLTLVAELSAVVAYRLQYSSFPIYHLYNPMEFFLTSLYFNERLAIFRRRRIGLIIGSFGVFVSILNTVFLQEITSTNSYFLLFEATAIIIYALLALHQILLDEEQLPYRFVLFWFSICFIIYWSATFTGWGFFAALGKEDMALISIFDKVLTAANFVFYLGIGIVFLLYPKMIPSPSAT